MADIRQMLRRYRKLIWIAALALVGLWIIPRLFLSRHSDDISHGILSQEQAKLSQQESVDRETLIRAHYEESMNAYAQKNYDQASDAVNKLLQLDPQHEKGLELREDIAKGQALAAKESSATLKKELWLRDLMQRAELAMKNGDRATARITLHQILEEQPQHAAALDQLKKLDEQRSQKESASEEDRQRHHEAMQEAEKLYRLARDSEQNRDWFTTYNLYKKLIALADESGVAPPDGIDLQRELKRVEGELLATLESQFRTGRQLIGKGNQAGDTDEKMRFYHEAVLTLKDIQKPGYPEHSGAAGELDEAYRALNRLAEPVFIRAQTLEELETCELAIPDYKRAKEIARFSEVPVFRMASKALENCKGE